MLYQGRQGKLTKEQAEAWTYLNDAGWRAKDLLSFHGRSITKVSGMDSDKAETFRTIPFEELLYTMANGYNLIQTAEERLVALYKEHHYDGNDVSSASFVEGIYTALEMLGIKIEGINLVKDGE